MACAPISDSKSSRRKEEKSKYQENTTDTSSADSAESESLEENSTLAESIRPMSTQGSEHNNQISKPRLSSNENSAIDPSQATKLEMKSASKETVPQQSSNSLLQAHSHQEPSTEAKHSLHTRAGHNDAEMNNEPAIESNKLNRNEKNETTTADQKVESFASNESMQVKQATQDPKSEKAMDLNGTKKNNLFQTQKRIAWTNESSRKKFLKSKNSKGNKHSYFFEDTSALVKVINSESSSSANKSKMSYSNFANGQFVSQCHILTARHLLMSAKDLDEQAKSIGNNKARKNLFVQSLQQNILGRSLYFLNHQDYSDKQSSNKNLKSFQNQKNIAYVIADGSRFLDPAFIPSEWQDTGYHQMDWVLLKTNITQKNVQPIEIYFDSLESLHMNNSGSIRFRYRGLAIDNQKVEKNQLPILIAKASFIYDEIEAIDNVFDTANFKSHSGMSGGMIEYFDPNDKKWKLVGLIKGERYIFVSNQNTSLTEVKEIGSRIVKISNIYEQIQNIIKQNPCN